LRRHAPPALEDAFAVQALTKAGVVNLGKVGLSEYAYSGLGLNPHFGTPPNPLSNDGARVPGGSSSGSAVAVSAGIVPLGMGTDTGGSIRIPAAFQGLVGYRPSSNRLNKSGVYPLSRTLDDIGPIARTVEDCALVYSLLRGQKPPSVMPVAPSGLRMLVPNNLVFDDAEPEVVERFSAMLNRLAKAGVHIKHSEVPAFDELQRLTERHGTIAAAEAYQLHQEIVDGPNAQRIDRRVLARLQRGRSMSALDWLVIQDRRNQLKAELLETLDGAWLLMPTVPHVAPLVATLDADDQMFNQMNLRTLRNTSLGNFFDLCGVSLPIGTGKGGMPVGALLSGPPGSDESLFCVAATVAHCLE
jgi:aspartyl-tRNA(Asn)/glutamyl-tRNA(Gln) amidotransferase subunit A